MPPEQFVARMQELEAEKAKVAAGLETAKESDSVIALHPKALDRYKRAVRQLAEELKRGTPTKFATVRELVTAIIVHASPSRPGGAGSKASVEDDRSVRIDIKGRLAGLCSNPSIFPNVRDVNETPAFAEDCAHGEIPGSPIVEALTVAWTYCGSSEWPQ
jgi:site-specific DNA recombinase